MKAHQHAVDGFIHTPDLPRPPAIHTRSTRLSPSSTQGIAERIEHMTPQHQPRYTTPRPNREPAPPTRAHMRFGMPASWEDMEMLGLDPVTGQPTERRQR